MMIPNISAPVNRRALFETARRQTEVPGVGEPENKKHLWELIPGANPDPNDPQRFLYPVSCDQDCYLYSGFSLAACLAVCRRI